MPMEFERDIYQDMLQWKAQCEITKTALEIKGARQIGKTHIIRKFCRENYAYLHEINLKHIFDRAKLIQAFGADVFKSLDVSIPADANDLAAVLRKMFPTFEDSADTVL